MVVIATQDPSNCVLQNTATTVILRLQTQKLRAMPRSPLEPPSPLSYMSRARIANRYAVETSIKRNGHKVGYTLDVHKSACMTFHDPVELSERMSQPLLWLVVFGSAQGAIPAGGLPYLVFMSAGILAWGLLFGAIFDGISLTWARDLGTLQKYRCESSAANGSCHRKSRIVHHSQSLSGRACSRCRDTSRSRTAISVLGHLGRALLAVTLGSAIFSTFSLIAACIVKSRERFMGIRQVAHNVAVLCQ
jgi:hypothetical protein